MAKANSLKIAFDFVDYLRIHIGRGRVVINHTQLAKSFECSTATLGNWIGRLMGASIINRSPDKGPDGFEYWFTDSHKAEMLSGNWQEKLSIVLKVHAAGSSELTVKQRFDVANSLYRNVQKAIEREIEELNERIYEKNKFIEELRKEVSDRDSQINTMAFKTRELEAANREATTSLNISEQKVVSLEQVIDDLRKEAEEAAVRV